MQKTARLNHTSAAADPGQGRATPVAAAPGQGRATLPSALDTESQYLYILVPMSGGQQVLRTRLAELLRVAERVGDAFPELGGGYELPNAAFSDVTIDVLARTVTKRGADVALTPLEFDLLVALFDRKGAAVSRRELLRDVWKGKNGVTTRTVDTHIFNLRQKLENDPSRPAHFVTVSKIGYRLKF